MWGGTTKVKDMCILWMASDALWYFPGDIFFQKTNEQQLA